METNPMESNTFISRIFRSALIVVLCIYAVTLHAQPALNSIAHSSKFNASLNSPLYADKYSLPNYTAKASTSNQVNSPVKPDFYLFGNFGNNILNSFKGKNIYLPLAAVASTYLLVSQNVDYHVEHFFNTHEEFGKWARPVVITGSLLPFIVGGSLFSYAKLENDNEVLGASFAVIQASVIELLYNSTLKAITGRPHPDWKHSTDMKSLSKQFRFGFLRGGVFWGWPSGHTAATMAVVSALTNYYPRSTWLKIVGYSLVAYTIFGVSSFNRGGMHWFSDAIAAALMSYAVGSTVGKYYRSLYSPHGGSGSVSSNMQIGPALNPLGINLAIQF